MKSRLAVSIVPIDLLKVDSSLNTWTDEELTRDAGPETTHSVVCEGLAC